MLVRARASPSRCRGLDDIADDSRGSLGILVSRTDPMRVAAIYDVHGNLPALEAVLRDVRDVAVDTIVVGGDVIPGPMPREAIELLAQLDRPTHFLVGNGEREVLAVRTGAEAAVPARFQAMMRWTAEQLDDGMV